MGFITTILSILGLVEQDAPVIERLIGGIGKFVAQVFKQLFGDAGATMVTTVVDHAENLARAVDQDAAAAVQFVKDYYGDLDTLLQQVPGVAQNLYVTHNLMRDHNIPRAAATKIAEAAHANLRTAGT